MKTSPPIKLQLDVETVIDRSHARVCPLQNVVRRLEEDPNIRIETNSLLAALNAGAQGAIPEVILTHLRNRLDGQSPKERGRPKPGPAQKLRNQLILIYFEKFELWLQWREERVGLAGWPRLHETDWWQGPPSERAARMVRRRLKLNLTWERIRNIAYEMQQPMQD